MTDIFHNLTRTKRGQAYFDALTSMYCSKFACGEKCKLFNNENADNFDLACIMSNITNIEEYCDIIEKNPEKYEFIIELAENKYLANVNKKLKQLIDDSALYEGEYEIVVSER